MVGKSPVCFLSRFSQDFITDLSANATDLPTDRQGLSAPAPFPIPRNTCTAAPRVRLHWEENIQLTWDIVLDKVARCAADKTLINLPSHLGRPPSLPYGADPASWNRARENCHCRHYTSPSTYGTVHHATVHYKGSQTAHRCSCCITCALPYCFSTTALRAGLQWM